VIRTISAAIAVVLLMGLAISASPEAARQDQASPTVTSAGSRERVLLDRYCVTCHSARLHTAGLTLETLDLDRVGRSAEVLEKVVRKMRTGTMPPAGMPHPPQAESVQFVSWLEEALDRAAKEQPDPGRPAIHRLNRAEYSNAVRDLLALDVDVASLLPPDDSALGFDNIADILSVSPSLLERYMSAARQISQLALGESTARSAVYTVPADLVQDERVSEELPLGSRGGIAIRHYFPADGEYLIKIRLQRNAMEEIRGLIDARQVDLRIDGERVKLFSVGGEQPEKGKEGVAPVHTAISTYLIVADDGLEVRRTLKAGPHLVGVTVVSQSVKPEGPYQPPITPKSTDVFVGRHTGFGVGLVEIRGPENVTGLGDTPSRRRILVCQPSEASREAACARQILSTLARRAFRRPVTELDLQELLASYASGRSGGRFETGIGLALRRMLMSPYFLFRIEQDPPDVAANAPYRLADLELASRLSFFLWSSLPDEQLLDLAVHERLKDPLVLEQQVRRMLRDPRSTALLTNFAGQWLEVRNLPLVTPNEDIFPNFDENLRQAFREETELFLESILREDRSVIDLLTADYTFLNERLARFYGIPNVYGERFRRVALGDGQNARAGILGQGSVLTVTSYATRTSPVLRGKWILSNLLGAPPPPPPPDVPALQEKGADGTRLSMRQAMETHRKNPACASCHSRMDPLGFALENFDAIGQFRTLSESKEPVDASGALPDGTPFDGPAGLRQALLGQRQDFVETLTEKLLVYALGRGLAYSDMPAVRAIVRESGSSDYRVSSIVLGVVQSLPFQMRKSAGHQAELTAARDR
jgi:hypothetical protein